MYIFYHTVSFQENGITFLQKIDQNQGCQIFLGPNIPHCEKYNKRPQTISNGDELY
jgi:hypothetical protein